jgi:ribosome-associated protein
MIRVTDDITLDENELRLEFVRASGPGGQNVNKVSSAVQLRFNISQSACLSPEIKDRLIRSAGRKVAADGTLVIQAHRYRSQEQNRVDAINRLVTLIQKAAVAPKSRRKTKPSASVRERRLKNKRQRSQIKQKRRPVNASED